MPHCLIGLGSNLGNRAEILEEALAKVRGCAQIRNVSASSFRETRPIGGPADQPMFLNAAAAFDTDLQPLGLLELLRQIEAGAGRMRGETWGPRTLDIDLLLYGEVVLKAPGLELPHPRMAWRRFVLEPAAEVGGAMLHPIIGWSVARLLEHLNSVLPYVAITGAIASGKSHLARSVCEKADARLLLERLDEKHLETFYANPSGHAWATEIEFLGLRGELLAKSDPAWPGNRPAVSDFWFDQSAAFARVWLSRGQLPEFMERWRQVRETVVQPKLLVVLDAPAEVCLERIRRRGRRGEEHLRIERLERIRQSILDEASRPGVGPVLWAGGTDMDCAVREVLAAIEAME
jgi:2-amino-4-hydroxy-6-hydroxymethyldihydropteridine diphosphokinase